MAERLLDDDASVGREPGLRESVDHASEQERRDLEVEDRLPGTLDRDPDPLVGLGVAEVAGDVREASRQALEHVFVELLAGPDDRGTGALDELVDAPVVD